ncbi:PH domain-containing protein [Streptomyces sp. WMMC500]|uniref:PH domain-containing protein n=1 Tax=Streptomyces sp. WMMC500 TaxID=3015154 RepID=UPI00248B6100|nr:PH domain-containing protein [Streptomyces sp. WMMC500]WBB63561.1 PH domain-containing protein [Streptomyces sp. WMMC500]
MSKETPAARPKYADRAYRSVAGIAAGVLLLALGGWLGVDALVRGSGQARALAVAALVAGVPLVVALTLRPVVYAGEERLRVRNPFRTIVVPWGRVEEIRAGYSSEVVTEDATYQMWAIPVSLRARKKANRRRDRAAAGAGGGLFSPSSRPALSDPEMRRPGGTGAGSLDPMADDPTPTADKSIRELRELAHTYADREGAQGPVSVRWAYEIIGPAVAGSLALIIAVAVG